MQTIYCSITSIISYHCEIKITSIIIVVCFIGCFVCFLNYLGVCFDFLISIYFVLKQDVVILFSGYPQFFINFYKKNIYSIKNRR